jgi:hypothetical protein
MVAAKVTSLFFAVANAGSWHVATLKRRSDWALSGVKRKSIDRRHSVAVAPAICCGATKIGKA